jgi:predicted RNase H-like HicB family nuclease
VRSGILPGYGIIHHYEALNNILEVIELWIEAAEEAGETIPQPHIIAA